MKPTPEQVYASIEAATVPFGPVFFTPGTLRPMGQAARTDAIRKLMKYVRVKGVSVRKATGSMCYWTNVDLPYGWPCGCPGDCDKWQPCPRQSNAGEHQLGVWRDRARKARDKVKAIILAAYPDLDDRSDSMTDHFDFVFTVGFQ